MTTDKETGAEKMNGAFNTPTGLISAEVVELLEDADFVTMECTGHNENGEQLYTYAERHGRVVIFKVPVGSTGWDYMAAGDESSNTFLDDTDFEGRIAFCDRLRELKKELGEKHPEMVKRMNEEGAKQLEQRQKP